MREFPRMLGKCILRYKVFSPLLFLAATIANEGDTLFLFYSKYCFGYPRQKPWHSKNKYFHINLLLLPIARNNKQYYDNAFDGGNEPDGAYKSREYPCDKEKTAEPHGSSVLIHGQTSRLYIVRGIWILCYRMLTNKNLSGTIKVYCFLDTK